VSTSGVIELVYDGDCGLCVASVGWLNRRDQQQRINAYPSTSCTWDDIDASVFLTTVVARSDLGIVTASTAVATALAVLPGIWGFFGRLTLRANKLALLKSFHDWCYYLVANHRIAISRFLARCRLIGESCAVPVKK